MGSEYLPLHQKSPGKLRKLGFWRTFSLAVLIFIALNVSARLLIEFTIVGGWKGPGKIAKEWPEFSRGETHDCVDQLSWTHITDLDPQSIMTSDLDLRSPAVDHLTATPPYGSSATLVLSNVTNSDLLYFLSRGSLSYGSIKVDAVESNSDDVRVDIEARYWSRRSLEQAMVCKLEKDGGDARGVGIFTPRTSRGHGPLDHLRFDIHVQIPVSANKAPRVVKALKTALANFRHEIGDTVDRLRFEALTLEAVNGPVMVKSVSADVGVVRTSNGAIEGSFNSSQSLKLETANADVNVLVNLSSNSSRSKHTFLEIFSWDGTITSAVNLDDGGNRTANGSDSKFHVRTVGSNGQVKLEFPTQPVGSELIVDALTSNAPLDVGLHPAFDGNFILRTRDAPLAVLDEKAADPSGRGRERLLDYKKMDNGELLVGKANWDDNPWKHKIQLAHLQSTNAPVILTFKDV